MKTPENKYNLRFLLKMFQMKHYHCMFRLLKKSTPLLLLGNIKAVCGGLSVPQVISAAGVVYDSQADLRESRGWSEGGVLVTIHLAGSAPKGQMYQREDQSSSAIP